MLGADNSATLGHKSAPANKMAANKHPSILIYKWSSFPTIL